MPLQATSGAVSYDAFGGGVAVVPQYIEDVFSTYLYTGNGSTQTITNGIDLSTKGGLVWIKSRTTAFNNTLVDTVRGATKLLVSNTTAAEATQANSLTAFTATGFSVGAGSIVNYSGDNIASWTFREQPKFFDVVTYTGNGTAGRTVAHNLGSVPGCIIIKSTSNTYDWVVYHTALGNGKQMNLNTDAAAPTSSLADYWNLTTPTSSEFTLGSQFRVNNSGSTYVAYLFAHDAGGFGLTGTDNVISCGSFTTDGSGNATVSLGYEPQWVLFKNSAATGSWRIYDSMRGIATGGVDAVLYPNLSAAEDTGSDSIDLTSTGFLVKGLSASNAHIYIAIRRGPMKVPTSGTSVYQSATRTGSASVIPRYVAGFPVDWTFRKSDVTAVGDWQAGDRLRGAVQVKPNLTEAETAASPLYIFDSMTGYSSLAATTNSTNDRSWMFRRAPSFFDEVCYTGTGSLTGVTHNLGVTPELKIIKRRNSTTDWVVGGSIIGENGYLFLNTTAAFTSSSNYWDGGDDSATVFSVRNTNSMSDASGGTYVAYLFATCAGVSKVGSYTGTGTTLQIDCGFTAGARFVLIKRTNSTGDWYVWDSARGIIAGNDPYLLLNSTAAEVTSTDYIDTYSAGFELSSTAPAAINASGGTFIFLAIA